MNNCSVPNCCRVAESLGMCGAHYSRHYRTGDVSYMPVKETKGTFFRPRLPFAPLRRHAESNVGLASAVGVHRRVVLRWQRGGVSLEAAERACDGLGVHPCEVWGDDYWFAAGCPLALVAAQAVA